MECAGVTLSLAQKMHCGVRRPRSCDILCNGSDTATRCRVRCELLGWIAMSTRFR